MRTRQFTFAILLLFCRTSFPLQSADFLLKNGAKVLFLGDSNTFADDYIKYLEAFLFTRFPDARFELINRGMPSETVAGTSEPTHVPPRPDLHSRFSTVVTGLNPDVIVACYGMNDGIYLPPNEEVFTKFQRGIQRLIRQTLDQTRARLILMTPPPFDARPFANKPLSEPADYRRPSSEYDQTLSQFSSWLQMLRSKEVEVIDLHGPMTTHIRARREKDPSFILAKDGIHFDATGHMLVALEILEHWNAPGKLSEAKFDWTEIQAVSNNPRIIKKEHDALIYEWSLPLPMPIDPRWAPESVSLERVHDRFNLLPLQVVDLPAGKYRLTVDRAVVAIYSKEELEKGVNVAALSLFPGAIKSLEVLELVRKRREILQEFWVKNDPHPRLEGMHKESKATLEQAMELERQIRELCTPRPYRFELIKID